MDINKSLNTTDNNDKVKERWGIYRQTTTENPDTRIVELNRTLEVLSPQKGEVLLEAGTGSSYLTLPIAKKLGNQGLLISSDVNKEGLGELINKFKKLKEANEEISEIMPYHFSDDYFNQNKFPKSFSKKFDAIVSLATFHHFDCRTPKFNSGETGRINALKEFHRMLKKSGRLVISDVANNTRTQRYFDAVDSPEHFHPLGHPHDFFDLNELKTHLETIGFKINHLQIEETPWVFNSLEDASIYLNRLHNAKCTPSESLKIAEDKIGFTKINGRYHLKWQLMILEATKCL